MPPRYLQRMQRQSDVLRDVFGDPQNDPPPYPFSHSRAGSSSSSFQYRRSRDLSAYQSRLSQDSSASAAYHRSTAPSPLLHYRLSEEVGSERSSYQFPPPPGYVQATISAMEGFDITAIPRDSLVLVTGANSYQGLHIIDQLLQRGFRVRGTVRDAGKAVWTAKLFRDRHGAGRFMTAVIPDMAAQHAFNLAVRGCSGVVHVASVTTPSANPHEVITPSIAGALNALEAAAKEPNVRRVVFASCASAAVSRDRGVRNVVGGQSWNMSDFEDAWAVPVAGGEEASGCKDEGEKVLAVQASAKMQAEQAVWRWYWERRPGFVLNTVLADTLWGAPLCPSHHQQEDYYVPTSVSLLSSVLSGRPAPAPTCGHFVNVSDSASLHLAALLFPDVRHERIFAVRIPWTLSSITSILKRWFPERMEGRVSRDGTRTAGFDEERSGWPEQESHGGMDLTVFKDVERADVLLKRMGRQRWRDLEESLRGAVEGFL